jgi:hypothetical protein
MLSSSANGQLQTRHEYKQQQQYDDKRQDKTKQKEGLVKVIYIKT